MIQLCAALTYGLHHSSGFDACIYNNKTILPAPTLKKRPKLHIIEYEKKNCIPNTQFKGTTGGCIGKPNKHGICLWKKWVPFFGDTPAENRLRYRCVIIIIGFQLNHHAETQHSLLTFRILLAKSVKTLVLLTNYPVV